jgi:hypothetical protein
MTRHRCEQYTIQPECDRDDRGAFDMQVGGAAPAGLFCRAKRGAYPGIGTVIFLIVQLAAQ